MSCFGNHYDKKTFFYFTLAIEAFFLIAMIVEFITDYTEEGEDAPTRDIAKIVRRYLKGSFAMDFIPIIPL